MRLYRAQIADGRWMYPLQRTDRRNFVGAEYARPDPTGQPFLLAEDGAEIFTVSPGRPAIIGWHRQPTGLQLFVELPEFVALADWDAVIGGPASGPDGKWHHLISSGVYIEELAEPVDEFTQFDTGAYADAPFDMTSLPDADPDPDWVFQPNPAFAVFGPVYARFLPGAVLGMAERLAATLAAAEGVSGVMVEEGRVVGVLTLVYEDNRRITSRVGRARRTIRATHKITFRIPFANFAAGESKVDAIEAGKAAIAEAVATLPVSMVACARCEGLGVVAAYLPTPVRYRPFAKREPVEPKS